MQRFYSHGKLLLTGEYAVLDGALALALTTTFGQHLKVQKTTQIGLQWESRDSEGAVWFRGHFMPDSKGNITFTGKPDHGAVGQRLADILQASCDQNPDALSLFGSSHVIAELEFPPHWGLGSSSTLIQNIALWTQTNAYTLLFETLGGSGYDIACAQSNGAILYRLDEGQPMVEPVDFDPSFKDRLCFVYLGRKQKSEEAIAYYRESARLDKGFITSISELSRAVLHAKDLGDFEALILEHETLMSEKLNLPAVGTKYADFPGALKSLGAWGGDFMLATRAELAGDYFKKKGLTTVIPYSEMIL